MKDQVDSIKKKLRNLREILLHDTKFSSRFATEEVIAGVRDVKIYKTFGIDKVHLASLLTKEKKMTGES